MKGVELEEIQKVWLHDDRKLRENVSRYIGSSVLGVLTGVVLVPVSFGYCHLRIVGPGTGGLGAAAESASEAAVCVWDTFESRMSLSLSNYFSLGAILAAVQVAIVVALVMSDSRGSDDLGRRMLQRVVEVPLYLGGVGGGLVLVASLDSDFSPSWPLLRDAVMVGGIQLVLTVMVVAVSSLRGGDDVRTEWLSTYYRVGRLESIGSDLAREGPRVAHQPIDKAHWRPRSPSYAKIVGYLDDLRCGDGRGASVLRFAVSVFSVMNTPISRAVLFVALVCVPLLSGDFDSKVALLVALVACVHMAAFVAVRVLLDMFVDLDRAMELAMGSLLVVAGCGFVAVTIYSIPFFDLSPARKLYVLAGVPCILRLVELSGRILITPCRWELWGLGKGIRRKRRKYAEKSVKLRSDLERLTKESEAWTGTSASRASSLSADQTVI